MRRHIPIAVALAILVAVPVTLMASSHGSAENTMAAEPVDMEAARATFEQTCSKCHSVDRPLGKKKDQAGWENTVARMSSYHERRMGAAIPEEDQNAIVRYLLEEAGK